MNTHLRVVLVDFGFACMKDRSRVIAADDYLPTFDGCPKEGRDLFLFLAHLWNVEALRNKLSPRLQSWIRGRLVTPTMSWADHLKKIADRTLQSV